MTTPGSSDQRAHGQLGLPFVHTPRYAADFMPADSNAAALTWLASADWPQARLALWGPAGSGKTHLLRLWARRHGVEPLNGPALGLDPPLHPIAIDDADAAPERPLLHLLNAAAEAGLPVLLAARPPPGRWPTHLADLASRLRAMTAVEIGGAEEGLLRALLARLLADRQLAVPETLQDWLRLRLPRTPAAMREAAAMLDQLALADGGRVNRITAARVLADMTHGEAQPRTAGAVAEDRRQDDDFAAPDRHGFSAAQDSR